MYDAIVVGGGIVGASVGYHLARAGLEPLLVDRHDEGAATDAGAGIIAPATSSRTASDIWFRFAVDAFDYYPTLATRLTTEQDGPVGFQQPGLLAVATAREREAFETALARIRDRQADLGHPESDSLKQIPPADAQAMFPPLAAPDHVFHYRNAGRVNGRAFADALLRAGERHGLATEDATVEAIRVTNGAVTGVVIDGTARDASTVIVAGGAWSTAFGNDLDITVPVEPHRGQILHLSVDADTADWPTVTVFGGEYLVPRAGGEIAAGATREPDAGFDVRVTAGGVHEILDASLAVAPGLATAEFTATKVGLRPASPDGLPILGAVPGIDGAYLATGHGATGLQLGPYSGRLVAQMVLGEEPETEVSHLRVDRFGDRQSTDSER